MNKVTEHCHLPFVTSGRRPYGKHTQRIDCIPYGSRFMNSQLAVALFDRCEDGLIAHHMRPLVDHPDLARISDLFDVGV